MPTVTVNDIPIAEPESYSVLEDGRLIVAAPGILANDHDVETVALSATLRLPG